MIIVIDDNARFKSEWREIVIRMKIERDRIFENMGKKNIIGAKKWNEWIGEREWDNAWLCMCVSRGDKAHFLDPSVFIEF